MTRQRDLKALIRQRMAATGEPYTLARTRLLAAQVTPVEPESTDPERDAEAGPRTLEVAVLKVLDRTARVRELGADHEITLRTSDLDRLVPGEIATVDLSKEWRHRGVPYASGKVTGRRLDVARLGLVPIALHLEGHEKLHKLLGDDYDLDAETQAYFRRSFAEAVPVYRMDDVAYVHPDDAHDPDDLDAYEEDDVVTAAVALRESGDRPGATWLLMEALATEPRFLDAHAHLGNWALDHFAERALAHYAVGVALGDVAIGADFRGLLPWGIVENRAYLRCLHGYALALWKLGRFDHAAEAMRRLLRINPTDNQGARFCLPEIERRIEYVDVPDDRV